MTTDTSERGLERLICTALTGSPCDVTLSPTGLEGEAAAGGIRLDLRRTRTTTTASTRPIWRSSWRSSPRRNQRRSRGYTWKTMAQARRKFLARLQGEVSKRGVIDVLRKGVKDGPHHVELFYGTPSPGNPAAVERYAQNRFSVTRQLRYSCDETHRALDLGLFINGLPIATFELKNSLTKQTVGDAVEQYKRDRDPREKLFEFGRSVAHFAVDDHEVRFCTHLKGKASWFLPFNQGWNDGAGNPPNPDGVKTDYLLDAPAHPRRTDQHPGELCASH